MAGHLDPLVLSDNYVLKLGGLAQPQQEDVAEELVGMLGERDSHPYQEATDWQPLAQGNQSAIFGPGDGALYWLTPRQDLSLAVLERTELLYQC